MSNIRTQHQTYGVPRVSKLLVKTGQLSNAIVSSKRAADTGALLMELFCNAPSSSRSAPAIARMNYLHGHYPEPPGLLEKVMDALLWCRKMCIRYLCLPRPDTLRCRPQQDQSTGCLHAATYILHPWYSDQLGSEDGVPKAGWCGYWVEPCQEMLGSSSIPRVST